MADETTNESSRSPRRYAVYLIYRHADNKDLGRQWATWLHQMLESYEVPPDLVGTRNNRGEPIPASLYPVFRDEEELPADADLTRNIRSALENSALLVVLCSPRAVASRFVAEEIRHFKELGKSDRILALMVDGEPNASDDPAKQSGGLPAELERLPEPLRFGISHGNGNIDWSARTEPIAADVRLGGRPVQGWTTGAAFREQLEHEGIASEAEIQRQVSEYEQRLELAKLKIVAGALGVPLGELTRRDKTYQLEKERRRARLFRRIAAGFVVLALLALAGGGVAWWQRGRAKAAQSEAEKQRKVAEEQRDATEAERKKQEQLLWKASRADHEAALRAFDEGKREIGLAYLARAIELQPKNTAALSASADFAVGPSAPRFVTRSVTAFDDPVAEVAFSRDGRWLAVATAEFQMNKAGTGSLAVIDAASGKQISHLDFGDRVNSPTFSPDGRWVAAGSADDTLRVIEVVGGKEVSRASFGNDVHISEF